MDENKKQIPETETGRKNSRLMWVWIASGLLLLLPFLVLIFFAVPAADDFYFSTQARDLGFAEYIAHFYGRFTGRLLPVTLFYFNPMHYGAVSLYFIPLLLNLALFAWSLYMVIPVFTGALSRIQRLSAWTLLLLIIFQFFPSTAQGFYWLSGSLFYTVPLSLFLLLLRLLSDRFVLGKPGAWRLAAMSLLSIMLPLSNEVILFPAGLILFLVFLDSLKRKQGIGDIILISAGLVLGVGIQLLAPGNYARMDDFSSVQSELPSFIRVLDPVAKLWALMLMNPLLWLGSLLFLSGIPLLPSRKDFPWLKKLAAIPLYLLVPAGFLLMVLMYLPSEHFSGYIPWRIHNTGSIIFLLLWMIFLFAISWRIDIRTLPIWASRTILIMILVVSLSDFSWKGSSSEVIFRGNIPKAWSELFTKALPYSQAWHRNFEESEAAPGTVIELCQPELPPSTIFFTGLTSEQDHDLNRWYSLYFRLEGVKTMECQTE